MRSVSNLILLERSKVAQDYVHVVDFQRPPSIVGDRSTSLDAMTLDKQQTKLNIQQYSSHTSKKESHLSRLKCYEHTISSTAKSQYYGI